MLGSLTLYLKGMRITMFHLSGFYCHHILSQIVAHINTIRNLSAQLLGPLDP